jgi:hypothetical protein
MGRVLADEERREIVDCGLDDTRPSGAFADTCYAFVRVDFQKQPISCAWQPGGAIA